MDNFFVKILSFVFSAFSMIVYVGYMTRFDNLLINLILGLQPFALWILVCFFTDPLIDFVKRML